MRRASAPYFFAAFFAVFAGFFAAFEVFAACAVVFVGRSIALGVRRFRGLAPAAPFASGSRTRAATPLASGSRRAGGLAPDVLGLERGGAHVAHAALGARGLAREAHAAAVEDEDVGRVIPLGAREDRAEIGLDLLGVAVLRPSEALAQADHVGIDDDALGLVPEHAEDDVRRLAADARKLHELLDRLRHLAAVALDEGTGKPHDRFGLHPEEAERRHVRLDVDRVDRGQGPGVREAREELGRRLVHADVGRLRAEDDRHDELEGRPEIELGLRVRVLFGEARERLRRERRSALQALASFGAFDSGHVGDRGGLAQLSSLGGGVVSPSGAAPSSPVVDHLALGEALDRDDALALREGHQPDALGIAARLADLVDAHADRLPAIGDEHHLVAVLHQLDADDGPVSFARIDEDDPFAAAILRPEFVDVRALAVAVRADGEHVRPLRVAHLEAHDLVALAEIDALHAVRRAAHRPRLLLGEADALAALGRDEDLARPVGQRGGEQLVALVDLHADDALLAEVLVLVDLGLLDLAVLRDGHDELALLDLGDERDRLDLLARLDADEVHDRPALAGARREGNLVHLRDVDLPLVAEEEDVPVRRRGEELRHPVFFARVHADAALAAALLRAIVLRARALDVPGVRDGHDHLFFLDEILFEDLGVVLHDLGAPLVGVLRLDLLELHDDHVVEQLRAREDGLVPADRVAELGVVLGELLVLEAREPRQAHLEDGLRLALGQGVRVLLLRLVDLVLRPPGPEDEGLEAAEGQGHEGDARRFGVGRFADGLHDEVDVGDGDSESLHDLALGLGLPELVARAARDDVAPVGDEGLERLLEVQDLGAAVRDGEVDDAVARLQIGLPIELVDDDLGDDVLLQLDDEADAVAIALVANLGDALDLLLANELRDARGDPRLVHLVGDLGDDDLLLLAAPGRLLDVHARAHHDRAAAGAVRRFDAAAPEDEPRRGEVGPGDDADDVVDRSVGVTHQVHGRVDDLAQVVRRDVGRHADGDAVRAVDEQVRDARRHDDGLLEPVVEVRDEVDALLVDVGQELHRDLAEPRFGVPVRGRRVSVDRAVVALPVDERVAHRKVLGEADHRVVDRLVAVRVVLAEHVADDGGTLAVPGRRDEALLVRAVEDAPVDGLQPVAHIGDRSPDDHAHRVIQVRRPHLVLNRDGDLLRRGRLGRRSFGHA